MKILTKLCNEIFQTLGERTIARIYRDSILSERTRQFILTPIDKHIVSPEKVSISSTLLGIELKIGKRRLPCPDLTTARYLQIFARFGVHQIAVPYDISKIPYLVDELETCWQCMLITIETHAFSISNKTRVLLRNQLISFLRQEIENLGAGTKIPEFNQNTKNSRAQQI